MNDTDPFVCIPISAGLHFRLVMRYPSHEGDVSSLIEQVLWNFLDSTHGAEEWPEAYLELRAKDDADFDRLSKYGDPHRGYSWKTIFLPNGTRISMRFSGKEHIAEIVRERLVYEGKPMTPSEFAHYIAGHPRNAWRDLKVMRPLDKEWVSVQELRGKSAPTTKESDGSQN